MSEVLVRDGSWTFDGDIVRIVPGRERGVHKIRHLLGEVEVPLDAIAGVAYEPARKGGRLRLRLREGADPFTKAVSGQIPESANPYQLVIDADRTGVAEYFVDELRNAMLLAEVPSGPCDRYLLPGPAVPLVGSGGDGTASFDGETVRLEWTWGAEESKASAGPQQIAIGDLAAVEFQPATGLSNGHLRLVPKSTQVRAAPKHDLYSIVLWGFGKEIRTMPLLVAAVIARMPHPVGGAPAPELPAAEPPAEPAAAGDAGPDALVRRLRELGELHRDGILSDEEFTAAKQAVLKRM
ncbi:putative oligomerization/nucleic acid binding protein [Murinocardiopsis flavida]|uniref:Putative oligomerization/nucleic acid binding protein n=1 Tax=Murinocardiopsis flavida TaxID=645275 RepID=A0A2P8DEE7_9ACTN|nr:DUF4429 domain-containing protein [Murinocardiopsis flavida]PSK95606.1 putative oligomerization/nucleic acid binding protein [Murinocardiopsis flavida]